MTTRLAMITAICGLSILAWLSAPARVGAGKNCDIGNTVTPSGCAAGCLDFAYGPVTSQFPCGTFAVLLEKRYPESTWTYTGMSSNEVTDSFHYCPPDGTFEYRFKLVCKFCGPTIEYYPLGTFTCP